MATAIRRLALATALFGAVTVVGIVGAQSPISDAENTAAALEPDPQQVRKLPGRVRSRVDRSLVAEARCRSLGSRNGERAQHPFERSCIVTLTNSKELGFIKTRTGWRRIDIQVVDLLRKGVDKS